MKIECIHLGSHLRSFEIRRLKAMLAFGIPICFQYVIITAGGMILQSGVNLQGSIFIGGYTATNKLYSFLQCFAMSLGQESCTFVSQNFGAGLYSRVRQGVTDAVRIVLAMAVLMIGVTFLTRWQTLRIFLDVTEPGGMEALAIAVRYLTIMVLCFPILHILYIFRNVLQSLGVSVWSLASGFAEFAARVFMSRIVIGWIGTDALFLSEPASWFGAMLCVTLPYFYYCKKMMKTELHM